MKATQIVLTAGLFLSAQPSEAQNPSFNSILSGCNEAAINASGGNLYDRGLCVGLTLPWQISNASGIFGIPESGVA